MQARPHPKTDIPERLSIELTNSCAKGCPFCYNASTKAGETRWNNGELVAFVRDCAAHGVRAVSFGGGEPLEYDGVFGVLDSLAGAVFRSLTTNGLGLTASAEDQLAAVSPDKVHISIHFPHIEREVLRVRDQVVRLGKRGIRCGVNLLVEKERVADARRAVQTLQKAGIGLERIVLLPLRLVNEPTKLATPRDLLEVAGGARFQSMTCLGGCAQSPRFCAVSWDKKAAWCSYTTARQSLETLDAKGLSQALSGLRLNYCGVRAARGEFV